MKTYKTINLTKEVKYLVHIKIISCKVGELINYKAIMKVNKYRTQRRSLNTASKNNYNSLLMDTQDKKMQIVTSEHKT